MSQLPRLLVVLVTLWLVLALLSGCGTETRTDTTGQREQVSESHTTTKEVTVHTPTANGGYIIEKTTTTDTTAGERSTTGSKETVRTAPDAATNALIANGAKIAGAVIGPVASSATGGLIDGGTGTALAAILTAAVTAWGAKRAGEARQLREERDTHRDDANKGWDEAMALAKKIRPEDA